MEVKVKPISWLGIFNSGGDVVEIEVRDSPGVLGARLRGVAYAPGDWAENEQIRSALRQ